MANRTVSVELQAKVAGYVAPVEAAEKATKSLKDEIGDLGTESRRDFDKMEESSVTLSVAMKETGRTTDKAGEQMKETALDARFLATEIAKARTAALEAAAAFELTGDKADLRSFKRSNRYIADLEKFGKDSAKTFDTSFMSEVSGAGGILPAVGGVLVGFAPILAPLVVAAGIELGAALGGAITLGIGTVGLGAGIALAFRDPRVKQVATQELGAALGGLGDDITSAFAVPTIAGLRIMRDEVNKLRPELTGVAQALAPSVKLLSEGLAQGIDNFAKHLEKALLNSQPLVEWFAGQLPQLADQLGGLLENISEHADEEKFALNALFGVMQVGITVTEGFIDVMSALIWPFEKLKSSIDELRGTDLTRHLDTLDSGFGAASKSAAELVSEQQKLKQALDATTTSFETQVREMLAADGAAINYQQNIDDLTASVHENGRSLDINSQAGRNNRRVLDQLIGSIEQAYESNIKAGMGADAASLAFLHQIGDLKKQAAQLGLSKDVIDDYIRKLDQMRYAAIAANNALRDTGTGYTHHDSYAQGGHWSGRAAASGMFLPASDPGMILAGEPSTGGEWLIPQSGISQQRAYGLLAGAARPYGMAVGQPAAVSSSSGGTLRITLSGADAATQAFVGGLRAYVQGSYGGDVQLALGQ